MFPIGDERVQGGPPPVVTFGLIALNVIAFFVELAQPSEAALQGFIQAWGVVPQEYSAGQDLPPMIPLPFWSTLLTSMFLHGGWMHLGGNMLYLWIFGDNLEKVMGAARFLAFYLICGLAASFAHIAFGAGSSIPAVGASGAISGVLGGYLLMFPNNRVRVLHARWYRPRASDRGPGILDRHPAGEWCRLDGGDHRNGRRRLHGAHRRVRRRPGAGQADGVSAGRHRLTQNRGATVVAHGPDLARPVAHLPVFRQ